MTNDRRKDAAEIGAGLALAAAEASPAAAASVPGLIGAAWKAHVDRRVQRWWKLVCDGAKDAEELAARIERGLLEEDAVVVAGVVGGARAATSAVDVTGVAVIAQISRRYVVEQDLPLWFYRGALELFERLDAGQIGALRRFMLEIDAIKSETITALGQMSGDKAWRAFQTSTVDDTIPLTRFDDPQRLFGELKRAGLGRDSAGFGIASSPDAIVFERRVSIWLKEAIERAQA